MYYPVLHCILWIYYVSFWDFYLVFFYILSDGTEGIPLQTLTTRLIATPGKLREWLKQKFRKPRPVAEYLDEE